jgi:hypothetical protein
MLSKLRSNLVEVVRRVCHKLSLRRSKGSVALAVYAFLGLTFIDPSLVRASFALIATSVLLLISLKDKEFEEGEAGSWLWSKATTRAVFSEIVLTVLAMLPFFIERHWSLTGFGPGDIVSLSGSFMFAGLIAVALYLRTDLGGTHPSSLEDVDSLMLDHQRCITMYETLANATILLFIAVLLAPLLAGAEHLRELPPAKMIWVFYFFSGIVIWILRPCTARAPFIRAEVHRVNKLNKVKRT